MVVGVSLVAQPIVRTNEIAMYTKGDNQVLLSLNSLSNQTLPFIDCWQGTNNVFTVSSNGVITAGTNTLTTFGIQRGTGITAANGTVTNTFPKVYATLPTVTVTQLGTTNSTSNIVTSLTVSNFVYNGGGPNISNMWISAGQ